MRTKIFYFLFIAGILLVGCTNNRTADSEIAKISNQRDSLLEVSIKKDSSIKAFLSDFNEIENNLVNIKQRQASLSIQSKSNAELNGKVQDEVNENIKIINDLMEQNRKKITSLSSTVKKDNYKIEQLDGLVEILNEHIDDKDMELVTLKKILVEKNKLIAQPPHGQIQYGLK